ncbi:hypothetical protein ES708_08064 [subsurface metagenome]
MKNLSSTDHAFVYSLYQVMLKDNLNYAYRGIFTQEITNSLINFIQGLMEIAGGSRKIKKRVFYVMIECIQNVTRHQEIPDKAQLRTDGIFLFQSKTGMYNISMGNSIDNMHIDLLKEKLEKVNQLSKKELKQYYKTILKNTVISGKGGAGLGLIEIARKSGNQLGFKFKKLDDNFSFFFMDTLINELEYANSEQMRFFNGVEVTEKVMNMMDLNHINLLYRGQFSEHKAFDMLDVIENVRFHEDQTPLVKKRIFRIVIEMLENISLHGADLKCLEGQKIGIFLIGREGKTNRLITGNLIMNDSTKTLAKQLEYINSINKKKLNDFFIRKLDDEDMSDVKTDLGFVDMRRKSGNVLSYQIVPVNSDCSFFSLEVNIEEN